MIGERLSRLQKNVSIVFLVAASCIFLFTAGFGTFSAMTQRALLLALVGPVVFFQASTASTPVWRQILNISLGVFFLAANLYVILVWQDRVLKIDDIPVTDLIVGSALIFLVIEATRRKTGWILTGLTALCLIYVLLGPYFPSILAHRGEHWDRLVNFFFMTTEGIYGIPMDVAATFIVVFVIFGSFLEKFGGGQWFVDVSFSIAGRFRGGPAKTAILGSALMGMISGSPAANVATVGCFTIPLMKQTGYKPHEAGAIEAVASTGGMFTPPIMGAGAFIMAQYLGVEYSKVIVAALIPSLLYYLTLMFVVDARAIKGGMSGLPVEKLPAFAKVMKERGLLGIPIVFMITAMVIGWSPMKTAFYATLLTIVFGFFKKSTRPKLSTILSALEGGSKQVVSIVAACAAAGIIVGTFLITGLGAKLSYTLIDLAHGNLYLAAFFTMLVALILGCAMPPTAVYVILVPIIVPALTTLGATPLSAHMFIFLFASVGAITPPVAIAAYAAAAIAESNPNKTGMTAFKFGLAAYIIPFMFITSPSVILQGDTTSIIWAVSTAAIGMLCIVIAMEGILLVKWPVFARVSLGIASVFLLIPERSSDYIGLAVVLVSVILARIYTGFNRVKSAS